MCGIAGAISPSGVDPEVVVRMCDRLAHRGPDGAGLWRSSDGRVGLGHRRLAIIDLDARSNQPMVSHDGRFVVTFNGEIYNYRSLRECLAKEGVRFRTQSDTEALLEGYRLWGVDLLSRLSGMFAFAIWDGDSRRLFCARDRAGEKPFYYGLVDGTFLFGSEVKALLEWPGLPRRIDYQAMVDYLTMGFVAHPKSIWRDIRQLEPAHSLLVTLNGAGEPMLERPARYWSLRFAPRAQRVTADEIRDTLLRAASEMVVSDVPVGTFLSGGVDSSTITAALCLSGNAVNTFTIGFDDARYDEREWARRVSSRYNTVHTERTVESTDVVSVLDRLTWAYDEPFLDYSAFPTYCLCREARRSITVALSGDGADEIFAGYRKYQRLVRRAEVSAAIPSSVTRGIAVAARHVLAEGSHWRRTLDQYGLRAEHMLTDMLCLGFPLPLLRTMARGPLAEALRDYDPRQLVDQVLAETPPNEVGLVNAMRQLDFALTLPGDMLVKVDRASMGVSLEVRPVFLHRDVLELAAGISPGELVDRRAAKLALKTAVRPWLPDDLLDRRKQGFAMPLPKWLTRDAMISSVIEKGMQSAVVNDLLDLQKVESLRGAHDRGAGDFTSIVYAVFTLNQWINQWLPS